MEKMIDIRLFISSQPSVLRKEVDLKPKTIEFSNSFETSISGHTYVTVKFVQDTENQPDGLFKYKLVVIERIDENEE